MSEKQLGQHVRLLGWVHIISGALFLLIGVFVFVLLTGIGAVSGDGEAMGVLILVGTVTAFIMVVLALPGLAAGIGLLKGKSWGRMLAMIVGLFHLFNFPLGTALGAYTLWVLLQGSAAAYFGSGEFA